MQEKNWILVIGALLMALSIGLGAFGAHSLKNILDNQEMAWWQTASLYLFIVTLGLLIVGTVFQFTGAADLKRVASLMIFGTALFSGSIFALALGAPRKTGMITPIGGIILIISWLYAAWCFYQLSD